MYYLNDKHPKFEYALYCKHSDGLPFIARTFEDFGDVLRFVQELEKKHNHYNQIYYIDNDFYTNKYSINQKGTYYKFLKRPVSDWQEFEGEVA